MDLEMKKKNRSYIAGREENIIMSGYLIKDTTKEERIALIRSWQEPDDCVGGSGMDLFDMYDAYIRGEKEIAEINGEFQASYVKTPKT